MKKPIPLSNITIQLPDSIPPEEAQKIAQAHIQRLLQQNAQERREYEIYRKGLQDGRRGLFGIFGL